MKKLVLALVIGSFMVGTAFAGIEEVKEASRSGDKASAITLANEIIADPNASMGDKAEAQLQIGYSLTNPTEVMAAFQKVRKDYPNEKHQNSIALFWIGESYRGLHKDSEAQAAFLELLTAYPKNYSYASIALNRIDYTLMSSEDIVRLSLGVWKANMPATPSNSGMISKVQNLIAQYLPGITKDNLNITDVEEAINAKWGE